jgi:hypothetical protein
VHANEKCLGWLCNGVYLKGLLVLSGHRAS